MTDDLLYEVRGDIGHVLVNRPGARNAFTYAMYDRLAEICREVNDDQRVKALILSGAGGKAFAAGTDIAQFRALVTPQDSLDYEARMERVLEAIETLRVPSIAAVAGACTGGGCLIAVACDLRIATADARFGFPVARTLGNCLSAANLARLVALVGAGRVAEMVFTARLATGAEAQAIGLVGDVVADAAALEARAGELARLVAGHAPLTLRATREGLRRLRPKLAPGADEDLILSCYMSGDFREGMEAFLAKRPPAWRGE